MNPISRIDTYFIKVHFNVVLPSTPELPFPLGSPAKIVKALLPSSICLSRPDQRSLHSRRIAETVKGVNKILAVFCAPYASVALAKCLKLLLFDFILCLHSV